MCTVLVGCIVGSSVDVWQETHPEDLPSASSWDRPWNGAASCEAPAGKFELARRAKRKDNAETQRKQRFRREDVPGVWRGSILCPPQNVNLTEPKSEKSVRPVKISLNPCPGCNAEAPPVRMMFSLHGGRYSTPTPKSSPIVWRMGDWNSNNSSGSVRSNRRKLRFAKPRNLGVISKSAPALARKMPGLTKFAWPSSLLDRSDGIRLPGVVRRTPEPRNRMPSRFQKLKSPRAKFGRSTMESNPPARPSRGFESPEV